MRRYRSRRKIHAKKFLSGLALFVALCFSVFVIGRSLPFVSQVASHAAIISAGINMPEGGVKLLNSELEQSQDEDQVTDMPAPQEAPAQTQESSESSNNQPEQIDTGITQEEIDSYNQNDGPIVRKTYTPGTTDDYINISGNAYVRNMTNLPNETVVQAIHTPPAFTLDKGSEPQVLIMHTHTTETYELAARDFYDNRYNARSRDQSRNVVRVGDEIAKKLEEAGIGVIHDKTEHDYPSYNGAYDRSRTTVQNILAENPSIKVVLDIHRDAISDDNGVHYAPVANINGKNAAQVMIISGCDDGTMNYPNYLQNLSFASLLQQNLENDHPGLTRPVSFKYKFYNQDLTTGSLLLEVGAFANSLEEAIYAGQLIGESLVHTLQQITQ